MIQLLKVGTLAFHEVVQEAIDKSKEGYVLGDINKKDQYSSRSGNFSYTVRMYKPEELVSANIKQKEEEHPFLEALNGLSKKQELLDFAIDQNIMIPEDKKIPTQIKKYIETYYFENLVDSSSQEETEDDDFEDDVENLEDNFEEDGTEL